MDVCHYDHVYHMCVCSTFWLFDCWVLCPPLKRNILQLSRGRGRGATALVMDADQHRPENVANAVARPKQQARWVTGHVTVSESDSGTLVMGNMAKSRSRSRQKVASAEAS